MSRTVTMDFREEYEAERTHWLRRRFLWYSGVLAAVSILNIAVTFATTAFSNTVITSGYILMVGVTGIPQVAVLVGAFLFVYRRTLTREQLLRLVFWLTVIIGTIAVTTSPFFTRLGIEQSDARISESIHWIQRWSALNTVFVTHFIASLFIPWTPRESSRPLIALLVVFAITTLVVGGGTLAGRFFVIAISPIAGVPGVLICWWRHSRFRSRFHYRMLRGRYGELQRELVDARRVHEDLFPRPIHDGPIRFHYCYEPMRQIGGDYLYVFEEHQRPGGRTDARKPPARLSLVLIDVTGHGVAAALTVNRIYGELERLFGEDPTIPPGEVLAALNQYVGLTLAKQSVYATALAMRFDPAKDSLEWANAGHPPAFVRTAAGTIEQLDSTAPLLGVFPRGDFKANEQTLRFGQGDTIVAYTDGATDTTSQEGGRLRIEGIQRILASGRPEDDSRGRWAGAILREIERFRFGAAVDDTLLVEVYRPVEVEAAAAV